MTAGNTRRSTDGGWTWSGNLASLTNYALYKIPAGLPHGGRLLAGNLPALSDDRGATWTDSLYSTDNIPVSVRGFLARRALAVALLGQGRTVEAGSVAGALAAQDGAASGAPLAHRVRRHWLQVEAAVAGNSASAAFEALAALSAVDADAAASLALIVAIAFPDTTVPLAPVSAPDAGIVTGAQADGIDLRVGPNPASDVVTVALAVPAGDAATVEVFDVLGRSVRRLHDGPSAPTSLVFDGASLPAGLYVVRAVVRRADGTAAVEARTVVVAH